MGVDDGGEGLDIGEVAERLDAAGGGAGADGDQRLRLAAHLPDALGVMRRGDRPLDQRQVVGPLDDGARRLGEVGDLDRAGDREQLVLAIEQA